MEHSLLHALQLVGIVMALGGAILMVGFLLPALKSNTLHGQSPILLAERLESSITRWTFWGAAFGALGAALNFFVDVAELEGRTIFGGVDPATVWQFATLTAVGRLSQLRLGALLLTAAATRIKGRRKWALVLGFGLCAPVCEGLICHAAAQPTGRISGIFLELAHILAVSIWFGVLIHLLLARRAIESATDDHELKLLGRIIRRFSPVAMVCVGLLGISGLILTYRYLVTPGALITSAYGLTLAVKMGLLLPLLYAGYINFRVIRPQLQATATDHDRRALLLRFGKTLELEVTAGVLVIAVAGILASVSPPRGWEALRLTSEQVRALSSPHWPRSVLPSPETFYGAPERTLADLHYAEFTHNWSGVMVFLLGCCWLGQSMGRRSGTWVEKAWLWVLMPLPFFIAAIADPEVWLLHNVTFGQVIQDPQLLEHQIGAMLAFALIGLGWLDRRRPPAHRPLGYILPVLMILGSLMLLGHAHSNFNSTQELTNLINVQHAVLGAFGLFAGVVRWLSLRDLIPERPARLLWPLLVIGLGLFMAFCYREAV
jgi:putative copper resistance protein D